MRTWRHDLLGIHIFDKEMNARGVSHRLFDTGLHTVRPWGFVVAVQDQDLVFMVGKTGRNCQEAQKPHRNP